MPPGFRQLRAVMQAQILPPRDDRHRIEKPRQVLDRVLDVSRPRRLHLHQPVQRRPRLEEDAFVGRPQRRQRPRPRKGVQILQRVLQRRDDPLVVGGADPLGVAAEQERQIRRRLPHDQARLEVAGVPRHDVFPVDLGDEAAHLEDQLAESRADPAAELEQVADQHPGIAHHLRISQPLAEMGHVAAHPAADRADELGDLGLGVDRPFVDRRLVRFRRPERVVDVFQRILLGRRPKPAGLLGDQLVDVLHRGAHHRGELFPQGERVAALLLVGLMADQVDVRQLEDRLGGREQELRHAFAQPLLEPRGDFEQAPFDRPVGPVLGREQRGAIRRHRRTC
ncbi:MAG: hypothetical protein LC689_15535 [Myxococcales bacterium]|nr:hypothetical protein [Myxococcales bacterium]